MKVKEESEKAGLKLDIKMKIMKGCCWTKRCWDSFPHIPYHNRLFEPVVTEYLKTDLVHKPVLIAYGGYLELTEWEIYPLRSLFPCFLQNWSNCKTVLYFRDPPTGHRSLSSSGYRGHAVSHRKTRCVFFKPWGSNLSQFFRIQFKGVRLELLAPICKRQKKGPAPSFHRRRPSLL